MRPLPPIPDWVTLEHQVAQILQTQEEHGWTFNERAAWELTSTLQKEYEETVKILRDRHPQVEGSQFTPKRNNKTQGYVQGATFTRTKELNPTSRDHIAWILRTHYGWTPKSWTLGTRKIENKEDRKPMIDEVVLKDLAQVEPAMADIAMMFYKCLDLTKKLGMLSEGNNAWLKLVTNSKIHHHCSVATNTHRCAHRNPNLACVPSDERFRKLFTSSPHTVMVGADLSGIELRMLAHYLARHDGGRYADILLNGDIHQVNADKIGISRRLVKTVTYAFLYGAGDIKIGLSYEQCLSENKARAKGEEIRAAFIKAIPGLAKLLKAIKDASKRGFIRAIDGRKIEVDSPHKALNYLLQGSAACLAKRWMVIADHRIKLQQISAHQLAFIHDELQYETTPKDIDELKYTLEYGAVRAGEYYGIRLPIAAESKSGNTWADVH